MCAWRMLLCLVFTFTSSLAALIAAFALGWFDKEGVIPFTVLAAFLATIGAVIGTTGKISIAEITALVRHLRKTS